MNSMVFRLALLIVLAGGVAAAVQASMYCGSMLVKVGDPLHRVARDCPEPFYQESAPFAGGHHYPYQVIAANQVWYLNFGAGKLMRRLHFVNGYLQHIDELGYGVAFIPGSRSCDVRGLANAGNTTAEIYAHCGEPDYVYADADYAYGHVYAVRSAFSRWIYSGGNVSLDRELLFQHGRLIAIRALAR